jgi:hypothetical protein
LKSPKPGGGDVKRIAYYYPAYSVWISTTTKEIIENYYEWKDKIQTSAALRAQEKDEDNIEVDDYSSAGHDEDEIGSKTATEDYW